MSKRIAVVTGGIGGLGTEICKALAQAGRTVVAVDLDSREARIAGFKQEVEGLDIHFASANVAEAAPLAATAQTTEARPVETPVSLALSTLSRATIETTAQIAAQIVRKLEGRSTRFEMALTPEGLGNVDVSLDIDADGKLIARMAFDNPLAATELRGRADELRRQLQDAGFTVADDALSFAERDASSGQQGGSAFDRHPDARNTRAFGAASRLEADADRRVTPSAWIPLTLTPDRVDMKV